MSATGNLQAATVISLTDQVAIGGEIGTENAEYIHLFLTYAKGSGETGITIRMFTRRIAGGTSYQSRIWAESNGVNTSNLETIPLTASGSYEFNWLLGAVDFVYFTQVSTADDGTPGTLAASYSLSKVIL